MKTSRALMLAALPLSITLSTAACSGSDNDGTSSTPSTSSAPSSGTGSNEPSVPADWKVVDLERIAQVQVPPNWTVDTSTKSHPSLRAPKNDIGLSPGVGIFGANPLPGGEQETLVEEVAKDYMEMNASATNLKRLPDETINGSPFYHIQYENASDWYDVYGTATATGHDGITLTWVISKGVLDRKGATALAAEIMPTLKLR